MRRKKKKSFPEIKRANLTIGPLLTNPLNSSTKLQICTTLQNKFLALLITFSYYFVIKIISRERDKAPLKYCKTNSYDLILL
jgi:hypothetical protein